MSARPPRTRWLTTRHTTWMVVAAFAVAALSVYVHTRAELRRRYGELLVCAAGPIDVGPEDAARAVRRRIWKPGLEEKASCADTADRVAGAWLAKWHAPELMHAARRAAIDLRQGNRPTNAEELWTAGAKLGYRVTPDPGDPRAPVPLVDRDLEELRARTPGDLYFLDRGAGDDSGELRATLYGNKDLVLSAEGGRPFARASWQPHEVIDFRPSGYYGQIELSKWVAFKGDDAVWVAEKDERGATRGDGDWLGDENALPIDGCRAGTTEALLVKTSFGAALYRVDEEIELVQEIVPAGLGEGALRSGFNLTCDGELIRVTWAASDPINPPRSKLGVDVDIPPDPQRHRVDLLTCTKDDCSHERMEVIGLDLKWFRQDAWSSSSGLGAPDAYAVGDRVLLLWETTGFLRYRFARLEELSDAKTESVVEMLRDQESSTVDPRAIGYNRWRAFVRGDVLLLAVTDESHAPYKGTTFVVRFDESGAVEVVKPR